jgi:hypothetical protein
VGVGFEVAAGEGGCLVSGFELGELELGGWMGSLLEFVVVCEGSLAVGEGTIY